MIKTIIFDMDGVLFDTQKIYDEAWDFILRANGIEDVDYVVSGCRGLTEQDSIRFIDENCKVSGRKCLDDLMNKFSEIIEEKGVPMKPGVYELLSYLKDNDYEIGLASSTEKSIVLNHLEQAHIEGYFQKIITGDMVKRGKPDPEIYITACSKFNRKPEECIAVEDSTNGVTAAINSGMKTIMVPDTIQPTKEIEERLYKKFDSLLDVKKFLES